MGFIQLTNYHTKRKFDIRVNTITLVEVREVALNGLKEDVTAIETSSSSRYITEPPDEVLRLIDSAGKGYSTSMPGAINRDACGNG